MSDVVLVDDGAVIADDLYAAGNRIVIDGRVDGDLVVAAYEEVVISGTVTGDVMGLAGAVTVTGTVGESIRVVSPRVDVSGRVGSDLMLLAWDADLAPEEAAGATVWAWATRLAGSLQGDLEGQMRRLTLGGTVGGNVDVTVAHLRVAPGAAVGQDLGYRSSREARGIEEAEVGGAVVHRLPLAPNIRVRALLLMADVVLGLMAAVIGLLVMWALPARAERAAGGIRASWWKAWLRGLAVMAVPPAVAAAAFLFLWLAPTEAALPLLGVLAPVFLAVLGVVIALSFLAPSAAFPWLGRWGNPARGPIRSFLYGAALATVIALVPWLGWAIVGFVIPVGIGGWVSPGPAGRTPA